MTDATSARYVYAIVSRDASLPQSGTWSGAAELAKVPWRDLAAVTSRMTDECAPLTMESMLHHEAVVEAVRLQGPALPVRFGTVFRDASSVASALAQRYEPLASDLARLGTKVELSLTALWASVPAERDAASTPAADDVTVGITGVRYLRARASEMQRDQALRERARIVAEKLDQVLGWRALERRVALTPAPSVAVRATYLLEPANVSGFLAIFDATTKNQRDVRLLLTGPWPPYSFVKRPEP